jgi:NAD(P)H-flavin reductase
MLQHEITCRVVTKCRASSRAVLLTLSLEDRSFAFQPGQAAALGIVGRCERRCYAVACSPSKLAKRLEFLIGEPDTLGLWDAAPGMAVALKGPVGNFVFAPPPEGGELLFIAGGTGIAPVRAMLHHALRESDRNRISVIYSARYGSDFSFVDELRDWATNNRIKLYQTITRHDPTWAGPRGRVALEMLKPLVRCPTATRCFICGPRTMLIDIARLLRMIDVPDHLIAVP